MVACCGVVEQLFLPKYEKVMLELHEPELGVDLSIARFVLRRLAPWRDVP